MINLRGSAIIRLIMIRRVFRNGILGKLSTHQGSFPKSSDQVIRTVKIGILVKQLRKKGRSRPGQTHDKNIQVVFRRFNLQLALQGTQGTRKLLMKIFLVQG